MKKQDVAKAITGMDERELRFINAVMNRRFEQLEENKVFGFDKGDKVQWIMDNKIHNGVVLRLNKKTVSVLDDQGGIFAIGPGFLSFRDKDARSA
jgi:hypothetical protein